MKKTINYEKDIPFKTNIGEICSISLEHDFTVDDDVLRGEFLITGEYKPNELSMNRESFDFHLPLEYDLDKTVDISTLSYDVENFEYTVHEDTLGVYIDFGIRYEEKAITPNIPEITENEINSLELDVDILDDRSDLVEEDTQEEVQDEEETEDRLDEGDKNIILESAMESDEYVTYHVHIVQEGETLEAIAAKYETTTDIIKAYNTIDFLEPKCKIIIPDVKDE